MLGAISKLSLLNNSKPKLAQGVKHFYPYYLLMFIGLHLICNTQKNAKINHHKFHNPSPLKPYITQRSILGWVNKYWDRSLTSRGLAVGHGAQIQAAARQLALVGKA